MADMDNPRGTDTAGGSGRPASRLPNSGGPAAPAPEAAAHVPPPPPAPEPGGDAGCGALWLRRHFGALGCLAAFALVVLLPWSFWWVHASGDVAVERVVEKQARGEFALFGSGVSQDFVDYKLRLYEAVRPDVAVVGSSRVMQFRGRHFRGSFVNVGGTAGNLSVLRSTIDAMLAVHRPKAVIIGLDFWWFATPWHRDPFAPEPPTSGSYVYDIETLKSPWSWLLSGRIDAGDFLAPLTGKFRSDRFGIMAQRLDDGFGSDGSWYYTADVTGRQHPFDYQFEDTLRQVRYGIKAFAPAAAIGEAHVEAFADIWYRLIARGVKAYVFIAPLSTRVLDVMAAKADAYPHLFRLRDALSARGIDVMDFTDPRRFESSDCEFVDGFHGGEVAYARILRVLADRYPALAEHVDGRQVAATIRDWKGHAMVFDERVTTRPETDFMNFSCPKRRQPARGRP